MATYPQTSIAFFSHLVDSPYTSSPNKPIQLTEDSSCNVSIFDTVGPLKARLVYGVDSTQVKESHTKRAVEQRKAKRVTNEQMKVQLEAMRSKIEKFRQA